MVVSLFSLGGLERQAPLEEGEKSAGFSLVTVLLLHCPSVHDPSELLWAIVLQEF